tara:strand:+ start:1704 stop:2732 length:1029 start_codon:yes stop_codon:yes gene_type:complete
MRKEPQIFTNLQRQDVPIDPETLESLEVQMVQESAARHRKLKTKQIEIRGYPFTVEIAETPKERAKGLSGRKYLPNGTGMLFKMPTGPARFHMRDTHVPLDILYLNGSGVVIMKDRMHPHTGHSRCDGDVHSVLELPAGTCDELAIDVGNKIIISNDEMSDSMLRSLVQESLQESWENPKKISDIIYRPWSHKFYEQVRQIKSKMHESDEKINWFEREMLTTDIGEFGLYESTKVPLDIPIPADLLEAEYRGKEVELNKPKRGGKKKYYVYVKNPKTGNVKKVEFGAKGMGVGINDPDRRASFVARHNCKKKNDKTKPGYWSCRLPRYWKTLGLKKTSFKFW